MTWNNKVVWTEGMFLQPQHFQQNDRHVAQQIEARFAHTAPYGWGFASLTLDDAALAQGQIALLGAHGTLPDGVAFRIPSHDAAPAAALPSGSQIG